MFSNKISYQDVHKTVFEGFVAYDDTHQQKRPVVIVIHDWSGRNEFAEEKAKKLAELGYVGFALDLYGEGKTGKTNEEKLALLKPLAEFNNGHLSANRILLKERLLAALEVVKKIPIVDTQKIAVMGFCFGGLAALDFARHSEEIKGVISFHGLLLAPDIEILPVIKSKILVLHGYDDPLVPPQQVIDFANEMTNLKADWQIHMYGHTKHAFANPKANDPSVGNIYDKKADARSWIAMKNFLSEINN